MGIRKHFENESKEDPDLKIGDLSLDVEKSKKPVFDIKELISDSDWRILLPILQNGRHLDPISKTTKFCTSLKLLFPKRAEELDLNEQIFGEEKDALRYLLERDDHIPSVAAEARRLFVLFPDRIQELPLKTYKRRMVKELKKMRKEHTSRWYHFVLLAASFKILFPDSVDKIGLDREVCDGLVAELATLRDGKHWAALAHLAADAKILFSDDFDRLGLTDSDYEAMKQNLTLLRNDDQYYFLADMAANLKIIMAEKVEITDQGIELEMPEPKDDFKQEKKIRPERKSF